MHMWTNTVPSLYHAREPKPNERPIYASSRVHIVRTHHGKAVNACLWLVASLDSESRRGRVRPIFHRHFVLAQNGPHRCQSRNPLPEGQSHLRICEMRESLSIVADARRHSSGQQRFAHRDPDDQLATRRPRDLEVVAVGASARQAGRPAFDFLARAVLQGGQRPVRSPGRQWPG